MLVVLPDGIVKGILPVFAVDVSAPITVGLTKLPVASDNSKEYIFGPLKVPTDVKATVPAVPVPAPQSEVKGPPDITPVVIVFVEQVPVTLILSKVKDSVPALHVKVAFNLKMVPDKPPCETVVDVKSSVTVCEASPNPVQLFIDV